MYTKKNQDLGRTGRSAQTAFLLHRLSFLATTGRDATGHVSHLCNVAKCFNPDHLCDESAVVNNSRKGCPGPIICSVHHHLVVDLCPHQPRCIRPERDDVNCCLALKESDPVGWALFTSRTMTSRGANSRAQAEEMEGRSSSEYEGAEFLERAVEEGLL